MTGSELAAWLNERPRVLDGAMGSELLRRGATSAAILWGVGALLHDPELVRAVHRDHAAAGAEALTANTFRVAPYSLRGPGLELHAAELARLAVDLARLGAADAGRETLVLASQTTLEDCYRPDLVPGDATLAREHRVTAELLASSGADALLLETFNTVREARAAALAATSTGLAVIVCLACRSGGELLSGEDVQRAAAAATVPGVVAVGVNCTALQDLIPALSRVAEGSGLPLVAYANNAFFATDSPWLTADPAGPERYARCMLATVAMGARLVGGCCGTTAEHVAALARAVSTL
jgi:S-methylmethionine-dependent homocysteine/selenocysteine methylase